MVKIIKEARAKQAANEIILVVSAGDDHIGNPFDELMGYDANSFQVDSAYHAYSAAGIDAAVIGNHELDRGTALLAKAIEQNAKFPILSANLYGSQHLTANHYHPAIIGVAKGLRIGIIGLTTKEETLLKQKDDPQFAAGELLTTLENTLPYVEPLADVIILLTHVGYNGDDSTQVRHELDVGDVQIAEAAAKMTAKPIVVIGGHLHLSINTAGLNVVDKSVPILEAGAKGSHLGEAVFSLLKTKNGGLRSQITARLIPLKRRDDRVKPEDSTYNTYEHDADLDLEFEKTVMAPLYKQLDTKLQEVIGTAGNSTDIATATTIADRYVGESAIANFMNDAIVARSATFPEKEGKSQQVQLAVFNASGISSGVEPSATIDFNDWYSVMPFADMIVIAQMTGAQIKEMVISNAQRLVRPEELTSDKPLDLTGYISRGFLHFSSSLQYTIKLNASATTATVQDVVFNGKPLDEQLLQTFNVAFSDYVVLRGGEGWNGAKIGAGLPEDIIGINLMTLPKNDTGLVYRNEIIAYLKEHQVVDETTGAVKDGRLKVIP
jgi:2',3'-cyclic-nucleotide 2'-phosphodiesterase (5'-nucleotidase family)